MKKQLFFFVLALCLGASLRAQEFIPAPDDAAVTSGPSDSLSMQQHIRDSVIESLSEKLEEVSMQNFMLQEALERTGRQFALDSVAKAQRRHMVDSLRRVTTGAPLVVDGDTLLRLFSRKGKTCTTFFSSTPASSR